MSREVFTQVIRGAHEWVRQAEQALEKALADYGPDKPVGWGPQTAYYLSMSYSLMGLEVRTIGQLRPQIQHARELLKPIPSDEVWLPYLGDGLDAGAATMLAQETLVALRTVNGYTTPPGYQGYISDTIMRELGIQLVDGRMPGFARSSGRRPARKSPSVWCASCRSGASSPSSAPTATERRCASRWSKGACSRTTRR